MKGPDVETAGCIEQRLARIIINKIKTNTEKMTKMSNDVLAMKDLQTGLLAKIKEIPEDQEGVKMILYREVG